MYTLEERLRDMKIDSGFKSLNYAICVMCILEGDEQAEEQLRPHLPRSDVAWARSLHSTFTRTRDICEKLAEKSAQTNSKRPLRSTEKTFHVRFIRRRMNNHQRGKAERNLGCCNFGVV